MIGMQLGSSFWLIRPWFNIPINLSISLSPMNSRVKLCFSVLIKGNSLFMAKSNPIKLNKQMTPFCLRCGEKIFIFIHTGRQIAIEWFKFARSWPKSWSEHSSNFKQKDCLKKWPLPLLWRTFYPRNYFKLYSLLAKLLFGF